MTMVLHKSNNKPNKFGGMNYRTLCGRSNNSNRDGMNVASSDEEVTCKFCLKRMGMK
jgi:hypothetical protein